jgi:putative endonuclease
MVAGKIEIHIKKMKSRSYLINLSKYPEIGQKLITKFS